MKLRLENGNFTIKALVHRNPNTTGDFELITTTLPKGLSYMDFIGTVVDFGISADTITTASIDPDHDGYLMLGASSLSFAIVYNQATGEISLSGPDDPVDPGDDSGDSGDDPVDPGDDDSGDAGK